MRSNRYGRGDFLSGLDAPSDALSVEWQGKKPCDKLFEDAQVRIARCTFPPGAMTVVGDIIWYSESGVSPNTLARFDSRTENFETWAIPSGGGMVRNMTATQDGRLVLACSGIDRIALVDVR